MSFQTRSKSIVLRLSCSATVNLPIISNASLIVGISNYLLRWYCFLLLLYAISRQKSTICCDRAKKKRASLPCVGDWPCCAGGPKKRWPQHIVWCAGRGAVQVVRPCRVGHPMRGGKAMHLFPGRPHSLPSCRTLPFSRIMSGDGESRTACATRGLAGDPAKNFWQGWGRLRGKGRPFFKKGPLPPHPFIPALQLPYRPAAGGCRPVGRPPCP